MTARYRFNDRTRLQDFDSTDRVPMILCEVPAVDNAQFSRCAVPARLLGLLREFDGERETTTIIADYLSRNPDAPPKAHLERLIDAELIPRGLLVPAAATEAPVRPRPNTARYLTIRVRIIPAGTVARLSVPLSRLFNRTPFLTLLPFLILTQVLFFTLVLPQHDFDLNRLSGFDFIALAWITTAIGFLHELGHAAGLARFGQTRAEIGWGVYIMFGVLYTDLSEAWRLTRRERAIVDLGGIYFHTISQMGVLALWFATDSSMLVYVFFFVDMQIVSSLNPFLRMDGYWLVMDFFGISDLRRQSLATLERWLLRMLRLDVPPVFPLRRLESRAAAILRVYGAVSTVFFFYFVYVLCEQVAYRLLPGYPELLAVLWSELRDPTSPTVLVNALIGAAWKACVICGFCIFLVRFAGSFADGLLRIVINVATGRGRARAALAAAAPSLHDRRSA
jgi:putative peptide zinc metalloprotease protein